MDLAPHWQGHLFLFDAKARVSYAASAGLRLIVAFLLLEAVIGPRLHLLTWLGLPQPAPWIRVITLVALALVLVRIFAGLGLSAIGLIPWREWGATERSYFIQVLVIANVVFYQELVYRGMLQTELTGRFGAWIGVIATNIAFAFGPLHYYYLAASPPAIAMLAGIFAIGLFFGVLRYRSGNLWLPAVFHGIGSVWVLGAGRA